MTDDGGYIHIAFEGIDGCGKTHQTRLLVDGLREMGFCVAQTCEPTVNTEIGEIIRGGFYKSTISDDELCILFAADRLVHKHGLLPQLVQKARLSVWKERKGPFDGRVVVVSDRCVLSAFAYHEDGTKERREWLHKLSPASVWPHHVLLIDTPVSTALERIRARGGDADRFEAEGRLEKARETYLNLAAVHQDRVDVVDGEGSWADVAARVWGRVTRWLETT